MSDDTKSGGGARPAPRPPAPPPLADAPAATPAPVAPPAAGAPPPAPAPIEFVLPAPKRPLAVPRHLGCMVKMIFGFMVLLLLGYFALIALNPRAREWATDKKHAPTPFKVVNQILAIPAQAIGKTKDVVAASDARVGVLDNVIAEQEGRNKRKSSSPVTDPFAPPPAGGTSPARAAAANAEAAGDDKDAVSKVAIIALMEKLGRTQESPAGPAAAEEATPDTDTPPPAAAPPAPPPEPVAPAQVKLAGGIIISSDATGGAPVVHAAFFYWVVNLNISGVFQSPPHRIMLNNRLVYAGDEINRTLGITFDRLDPAAKVIVFRDRTGATVTRSY